MALIIVKYLEANKKETVHLTLWRRWLRQTNLFCLQYRSIISQRVYCKSMVIFKVHLRKCKCLCLRLFKTCSLSLNLLNQQILVLRQHWNWPDCLRDLTFIEKSKFFFKPSPHMFSMSHLGFVEGHLFKDCFFKTYIQFQLILQKFHLDLKDLFL